MHEDKQRKRAQNIQEVVSNAINVRQQSKREKEKQKLLERALNLDLVDTFTSDPIMQVFI